MSVVLETTIGDITVDLFTEERPAACLNFIKLCKLKYYNYNLFHTIEHGFIAQTGDPSGAGDGGISVWGVVEGPRKRFFEAESLPKIYHTNSGLLSLVSAGKNLVASQFFLTLGANLTSLDGVHCVIGEVVEGHETLRKLNEAIVDENYRPYQDIRITHTVVLEDPYPDPRGFQVTSRSPSPSAERLQNGRVAADEDIDDTDGKTMAEVQEMLAEREAKARATILEIVGDLPDAEMAPPENVLFVCKLNPVTTDDDLEIIFSRFGKVKGCEVIRDKKTGDSLQYAFVEFMDEKTCEAAYFKMDNVLIDDRRIHVDFSQSVAKVKWRGKGRGVDGHDGRLDFNNLRDDNTGRRSSQHQQQRQRRHSGSTDRGNLTSEERRKAREERHRLQRQRDSHHKPQKSANRSRSRSRNRTMHYEDKDERNRYHSASHKSTNKDSPQEHSGRRELHRRFDDRRRYSTERTRHPTARRVQDKHSAVERKTRQQTVDSSSETGSDSSSTGSSSSTSYSRKKKKAKMSKKHKHKAHKKKHKGKKSKRQT